MSKTQETLKISPRRSDISVTGILERERTEITEGRKLSKTNPTQKFPRVEGRVFF